MNQDFTITVLSGATSSGKTKLALELAQKINAEIICADSRSVYKGLDIVSAKPKKDETSEIKHHLLDIVTPDEDFSAADFALRAQKAADEIKSRSKNLIIAGGTWFYIKSFLDENQMPEVGINKELREELKDKSTDEIWQMLNEIDPIRAQAVHKNNKDKVIRSIEMCRGLNMPVSRYIRPKKTKINAKWFMPEISREELYERINKRVDIMMDEGLYHEWEKNSQLYPKSKVIKNTIGYREFFEFRDITEAVNKIKQRTRNFAKRQLTYFRSNSEIIAIKNTDDIIEALK